MKSKLEHILVVLIIGCLIGVFITPKKEPLKYLQEVVVKTGFYKGVKGNVIQEGFIGAKVLLKDNTIITVDKENIELTAHTVLP